MKCLAHLVTFSCRTLSALLPKVQRRHLHSNALQVVLKVLCQVARHVEWPLVLLPGPVQDLRSLRTEAQSAASERDWVVKRDDYFLSHLSAPATSHQVPQIVGPPLTPPCPLHKREVTRQEKSQSSQEGRCVSLLGHCRLNCQGEASGTWDGQALDAHPQSDGAGHCGGWEQPTTMAWALLLHSQRHSWTCSCKMQRRSVMRRAQGVKLQPFLTWLTGAVATGGGFGDAAHCTKMDAGEVGD